MSYAVHRQRDIVERVDLLFAVQINDRFDLHDSYGRPLRDVEQRQLIDRDRRSVPPVPEVIAYRIPYAKSPRAQFQFKLASCPVRRGPQ